LREKLIDSVSHSLGGEGRLRWRTITRTLIDDFPVTRDALRRTSRMRAISVLDEDLDRAEAYSFLTQSSR